MLSYLTKKAGIFLIPGFCLFIASCDDSGSGQDQAQEILKYSSGGDFRGINIGDNLDDVKSAEDAEKVYSMPDELIYRIPPSDKDSTWYEISYNFNDEGLYNIDLEIFPPDDSLESALKNNFVQLYMEKYGDCSYHNGYCQWRAMTESGHIVSITLTDTLQNTARPCLKINFNESTEE